MPDPIQKQKAKMKKDDEKYLAILRDSCWLDSGRCPVCKREFRDQYACEHGWKDVKKANDAFLLRYMRER